jgi:hypothetical protein
MRSLTIKTLVEMVDGKELVLPAMQRPFVWQEDRIVRLIDSLLRGFPLGSLLVWETDEAQRYRPFVREASSSGQIVINFPQADGGRRLKYVLDGQQRLTSLYIALRGSLDGRRLYLDLLSGDPEDKDPGETYYDIRFVTGSNVDSLNQERTSTGRRAHYFVALEDLARLDGMQARSRARQLEKELGIEGRDADRLSDTIDRTAMQVRSEKALHVIVIDEHGQTRTPIEEILEIFVRVNSGGLVLQKSDLLMSLLDLSWNDVQPELLKLAHAATQVAPLPVTRDMVLKSALLMTGEESRFDKLVKDRDHIAKLAPVLRGTLPKLDIAWRKLGTVLRANCKISSPRFFRNATNALLPFVVWLAHNPQPSQLEERRLVTGVYLALMSGVFGGAEARMGWFAREHCRKAGPFPVKRLAQLVRAHRPVQSIDQLLRHHLDLTLNIAQGGVVLDGNPDGLERDHIFPRATLEKQKVSGELINHYANFHFLRGVDNRNKTDKPPHKWFREPGESAPSYTDQDMADRLLDWSLIEPGQFPALIQVRGQRIKDAALRLFGFDEESFNALFAES